MRRLLIGSVIAAMMMGLVLGAAALPMSSLQQVEARADATWYGEYFDTNNLTGFPAFTRQDANIDFNFGFGKVEHEGAFIGPDQFSIRWTRSVNFPTGGTWTFHVEVDDYLDMWIDGTQIISHWTTGGQWAADVKVDNLTAGDHTLIVEYGDVSGQALVKVSWSFGGSSGSGTSGSSCAVNWDASYFNNTSVSGTAAKTRTDGTISFDWGTGSPDGAVQADNFSARWTKRVNFADGHYRFKAGSDDGIRVWIDVTLIIDEWHGNTEGYRTYEVDLYSLTGGDHDVKVEYYEATGGARVDFCWELISGTGGGGVAPEPVPTAIPPTVVYAAATDNKVNVRIGPGLGNPVFTQIKYPDDYVVIAGVQDLSWVQIDLGDGVTGWVSNQWVYLYATPAIMNEDSTGGGQPDFVDVIPRVDIEIAPPAASPVDSPYYTTLNGYTTDTVNLRDGANLYGSRVIGSVPQGATFVVEAHNGNGAWYLIEYRGIRGWVSALYVVLVDGRVRDLVASDEIVPAPPPNQIFVPEDAQGNPAVTVRGQAKTNLKLRDLPSILVGDQIGSVPQYGEFVIEARNSTGAWYRITWEGQVGWVNAVYVTIIEGTIPDLPIE